MGLGGSGARPVHHAVVAVIMSHGIGATGVDTFCSGTEGNVRAPWKRTREGEDAYEGVCYHPKWMLLLWKGRGGMLPSESGGGVPAGTGEPLGALRMSVAGKRGPQ